MAEETPVFMQTVVSRLDFFLELLKNPHVRFFAFFFCFLFELMNIQNPDKTFHMTYGDLTPPFGFLRIKILEFLCALINTRYQTVVDAMWKTEPNLFSTVLVRLYNNHHHHNPQHCLISTLFLFRIFYLLTNGTTLCTIMWTRFWPRLCRWTMATPLSPC